MRDRTGRGGHRVASALCALLLPLPFSCAICHLPCHLAEQGDRRGGDGDDDKQQVNSNRHGHGLLELWVLLCAVQ